MEKFDSNTVYIIDSYGLIYRAYFAFISRPLTYNEKNISAVFGFFRNLASLIKHYKPGRLVAAFDSTTATFRHELYKEYKATRQKTPEDLHAQIPWIQDVLKKLNVPILQKDGFEADDVIATVAKKCKEKGITCRILSADKDLMQLVDENTQIMKPDKSEKSGGWIPCGEKEVEEEWEVPPKKLLDLLSLTGDSADNVPGVAGIGPKSAAKLLAQYNDLDGIYQAADSIKGALGNKIREGKESAYFSKKLISLRYDVPLEYDEENFTTKNLDYKSAANALKTYGALAVAKSFAEMGIELSGEVLTEKDLFSQEENEKSEQENKSENIELKQNTGNYKAVTDKKELEQYINAIKACADKCFAFDTETDGLNSLECELLGFSLSYEKSRGIYVPIAKGDNLFAQEGISKEDAKELLSILFNDEELCVVMHNAKFDLEVMDLIPKCRLADTMIAAWLLNPDGQGKNSFSLEYLAEKNLHLKGTEFSEIVKKGQSFADVPLEQAAAYSAEDSDFTLQLWNILKEKLSSCGLEELFWNIEMKILPILVSMEKTGIHLDSAALDQYGKELKQNIEQVQKEIFNLAGFQFNIASPKQLQELLFDKLKLPKGKKTKTGWSTDTAVLEEIKDFHPIPAKILEYRGMTKLLSTYVETLPSMADKNGRIHTSFLQTGTATGRLSSRDPNLQNIPIRDESGRKIRSAFTAMPGTVLISADYAQIELVVLAHLSGDPILCKAFTQGIDVHKSTASLIYGVEIDKVSQEMRRTAKTINFGVIYGMSAFRLAKELEISRTKAQEFINRYFETYSTLRSWLDSAAEFARKTSYAQTITGRRRSIYGINSRNKLEQAAAERMAINTPVQGSAADIVKQAMINLNAALQREQSQAKLLLQVHDELILECPDDKETISNTVALVRREMENAFKLSVPLRVSVEYGSNWGEFH